MILGRAVAVEAVTAGIFELSKDFLILEAAEMPLRIFIAGQKSFGAAVYNAIQRESHTIVGVACPSGDRHYDRLKKAAYCDSERPVIIDADRLMSSDIPTGTDVIVTAHAHHFISAKVRQQVQFPIGYHPSLLPRHRGRDAVRWTIKYGDPIAGGTVYMLNDSVDGGLIIRQEALLIHRHWGYRELWKEALSPLGIKLIIKVLTDIDTGNLSTTPQDESLATWEPPIQHNRIYRPELVMLE